MGRSALPLLRRTWRLGSKDYSAGLKDIITPPFCHTSTKRPHREREGAREKDGARESERERERESAPDRESQISTSTAAKNLVTKVRGEMRVQGVGRSVEGLGSRVQGTSLLRRTW